MTNQNRTRAFGLAAVTVPWRPVPAAWLLTCTGVGVMVVLLVGLLHDTGRGLIDGVTVTGPRARGAELFVDVLVTNGRTLLWCLAGWFSFGLFSMLAGSVAVSMVVISLSTGFLLITDDAWISFGLHAGTELLACALATCAGVFPAIATWLELRHAATRTVAAWADAYLRNVKRSFPLAACAMALIVAGAGWEAFIAVTYR
jgi:hypothetical protein